MKKIVIALAVVAVSMTGCSRCSDSKKVQEEIIREEVVVVDQHNSRNSLDYAGTYAGMLPCADCEGIRTELTIKKDGSYKMVTAYVKNGSESIFEEEGKYVWSVDGSSIELKGKTANKYKVAENKLIHLDEEGKEISGSLAENYVLTKK